MLSDIPERKIADIHPMDDERAGDAQDAGRIVWAELLILGEDSDPFSLEGDGRGQIRAGLRPARVASRPDLSPTCAGPGPPPDRLCQLVKRLGRLAVLVRQLNELQYMGVMACSSSNPNIGPWPI